jgi:hypothetical protein
MLPHCVGLTFATSHLLFPKKEVFAGISTFIGNGEKELPGKVCRLPLYGEGREQRGKQEKDS